jgi:glycosyltransferase involved in cell wall biosynthesis
MIAQSREMKSLSVALPFSPVSRSFDAASFARRIEFFAAESCVNRIILLHQGGEQEARSTCRATDKLDFIQVDSWISGRLINRILQAAEADGLLLHLSGSCAEFEGRGLRVFLALAQTFGAGLVYADSRQISGADVIHIPRIEYQPGSIRDTFGFGPVVLVATRAAEESLAKHGPIQQDVRWGGFHDLRLKLSIDFPIIHSGEPLYVERVHANREPTPPAGSPERPFYVQNRGDREYQLESEHIATAHLRRIGAYVESGSCPPPATEETFPVTASVVIPVRNREKTIADAIQSALNQVTSFTYNIIVVDDHSTDRTGEIIQQFASRHDNLVHIIPGRTDLGIGGMWNEAIYSPHCGLFAVQLDSDDVYAHDQAVAALVGEFGCSHSAGTGDAGDGPRYAMVIGSYTLVDFELREIVPGLDRRLELSRQNGRNNILCLEGPGAPRAFYVPVLRRFGFPNISFGEDYAIALRIGREYDIGRVFESVYLARRWEDNSHRSLPLGSLKSIQVQDLVPAGVDQQEFLNNMQPIIGPLVIASVNYYAALKDYFRTVEIQARSDRRPAG